SPPVAAALDAFGWGTRFSRVYNRVFEVLLVIWLVARRRQLGLGAAQAIGLRRRHWARDLVAGVGIGFGGLASALLFCWSFGGLVPGFRYPETSRVVGNTIEGFASAAVVGTFEEVVFRGVLLRRLSLDFGPRAGLLVTTAIYAAVHLLHPRSSTAADAWAGVRRTLEILAPLADPANLPTFVGLFAFGLILAAARRSSGSLWLPIGIHAAWVVLFRVGRVYFRVRQRPVWLVGDGWPPLIGSATGAVALAVTALLFARWRATHARS
ncbi:MAG TPA: CPBP family intramembrane glutamic endopeptidase, partial [Candidatus Limnocylindria bacterium]|nr:CPBP family intramembrane glutamic endopeptidase [Candidatus Limnocylindria bacterium]